MIDARDDRAVGEPRGDPHVPVTRVCHMSATRRSPLRLASTAHVVFAHDLGRISPPLPEALTARGNGPVVWSKPHLPQGRELLGAALSGSRRLSRHWGGEDGSRMLASRRSGTDWQRMSPEVTGKGSNTQP